MIQLIAYSQDETSQTVLDLSEATTVSLSYSIAELGEVTTRNSPFSQSFRLPQSEKNNKFFEHWYEVNLSTATFDARKKTRCVILDEGVLVIAGYLQLREVYNTDRSYTVSIFGDQANLYQEIGKKDLHAAFVTDGVATLDYDYISSGQNVVDSWDLTNDITDGSVGNGVVMIPLIDWGTNETYPLHYSLTGGSPSGIGSSGFIQGNTLKPAINLKHLFDLILSQAGYSYTSTFLNSAAFNKVFMQLGTESADLVTAPFQGLNVGMSSDVTLNEDQQTAPFDTDNSGVFYDPDDLWNTTSYTFVAPIVMTIAGAVKMVIQNTSGALAQFYCIVETPSGILTSPAYVQSGSFPTLTPTYTFNFSGLSLDAGEEMQITFVVSEGELNFLSGQTGSRFFLSSITNPTGSENIHIPSLLPDISQADFLKDIIQRFNLILEATPDNERHLIIEPYSDWVDDGDNIDWTGKLDKSKEVVKKPTNEFKKSVIDFRDLEGKDESNKYWQNRQQWTYGRYYEQVEDDFAKGTLKNDPIFKPFHVHEVPTIGGGDTLIPSVLIGRQYTDETDIYRRISDNPFLFYHNGLVDIGATIWISNQSSTQYPYCSAYNETPTDGDTTLSLYWGYQYPNSFGNPTFGSDYVHRNLWREYWGRFHNQIYSRDAAILEAYFYLTPTDILNLRFNSAIRVEEGVYRLLKVEGYTVNGYETTKCQLIKEVGGLKFPTSEDCTYVPDRWNADGTISFENTQTGATTLNPGEECCELHGGFWVDSSSLCYWQLPHGGTGDNNTGRDERTPRIGNQTEQDNTNYFTPSSNATARRTILTAVVDEGSTAVADENGNYIQVPHNTICRVTVNAVSVQTTYDGSSGSLGSTSFRQWVIVAKNVEGTSSASISENTDVRSEDGDVTTRTLTVGVGAKSGDFSRLETDLHITCEGETYGRVEFTLDCEVTYTDLSRAVKDQNQMLHQDGSTIILQNGTVLTR